MQWQLLAGLTACMMISACGGSADTDGETTSDGAVASIEQRIDQTLEQMTVDQKLGIVSGTAVQRASGDLGPERVPGAAGSTLGIAELGIPELVLADGPAGLRIAPEREGEDASYYATAFPIATALASSWDVELWASVGEAMGDEAKEYGVDVLLGPAMNIHRNPLTGRNFEYFSEDPYLSGRAAAGLVTGIQSTGVGATLKHFAANNQETNRFLLDTIVSERALREIYLRGFEIAVKQSEPRAIMSAYNMINGQYSSQSHDLLTKILRDEWGFRGLVMTDWFAGNDAVAQMQAGNELLMPGTDQQATQLRDELGVRLDEATLDRNVRMVLAAAFASPSYQRYPFSDSPDLDTHARIARSAAADGVVLLKNDAQTLPLDDDTMLVAAFGNTSYEWISGGGGSGEVNEAYTVSLVDGLRGLGVAIDAELDRMYTIYIERLRAELPEHNSIFELEPRLEEMGLSRELIERKAREANIAIVSIGRNSGEFQDRDLDSDFRLVAGEHALLDAIADTFHAEGKRVVVILNVGNIVEIASWRDQVDAIVVPWQGGQEGGNALADVLTGRVTPSARLATTFPLRYEDVPSSSSFPGEYIDTESLTGWSRFSTGRLSEVAYTEGVYVGYRYYTSFDVPTAYDFGFGLSYTDFEYGEVALSAPVFDSRLTATVDVTNSGARSGREVVQLYISAPSVSLDKPLRELKGFAKTGLLQPGESQIMSFALDERSLTSFDAERSAWVAEPGDYTVQIGASVRDIRTSGEFRLVDEIVEPTGRALPLRRAHTDMQAAR